MVVLWSAISYSLQDATPEGLPRRLSLPNTWEDEARNNWGVAGGLLDVTGVQIAYAMVPALILALLVYFDHSVSAQLAQQKDFQLVRPPAYNWDLLVVAILMVRCWFHCHLCCWCSCPPNFVSSVLLVV
jgi:boron transporter